MQVVRYRAKLNKLRRPNFRYLYSKNIGLTKRKGTIIFIHGFLNTSSSLDTLSLYLRENGWECHNWNYMSKEGTLGEHSLALLDHIKEKFLHLDQNEIHFCTHSLGGLVLRACLNHKNCPEIFKNGNAVMLGPPMNGTKWGRMLSYIPGVRYLAGNKVGRELLETQHGGFDYLGKFPDTLKILLILGQHKGNPFLDHPNDGKVRHSESFLPTPHQVKIILGCGHTFLTSHLETKLATLKFFESSNKKTNSE